MIDFLQPCTLFVTPARTHNTSGITGPWLFPVITAALSALRYAATIYIAMLVVIGEDTSPCSSAQQYFSVLVMLFGACFTALMFGGVALLVKDFDSQKSNFYEHMDTVNSRVELMGLPDVLRKRVKAYYAFLWKRLKTSRLPAPVMMDGFSQGAAEPCGDFVDELPLQLRADVRLYLHKDMVLRVPLFKGCSEVRHSLPVACVPSKPLNIS